jgi:hypothetical protein
MQALVAEARKKGVLIVHVPITFTDDYRELRADAYGILAKWVGADVGGWKLRAEAGRAEAAQTGGAEQAVQVDAESSGGTKQSARAGGTKQTTRGRAAQAEAAPDCITKCTRRFACILRRGY